jgi:hypothetical protein
VAFTKDFSREFVEHSLWFIAKIVLKKGTRRATRDGGIIAKAVVGGIDAMVSFENKAQQRGDLVLAHPEEKWEAIGFIESVSPDGDVTFRDTTFTGRKRPFVHWVLMYKLGYDEDAPLQ